LYRRPGILHSAAGFVTTIVNVYTARSGFWSVTAIVTSTVTGTCTAITIALLLVYDIWKLTAIKKEHKRLKEEAEYREGGRGRTLLINTVEE
jgi:hypothetical protein